MNESLVEPDPALAALAAALLESLVSAAPPHAATTSASRGTVSRTRGGRFTGPPEKITNPIGIEIYSKDHLAGRLSRWYGGAGSGPGAPRDRDARLVGEHHRLHAVAQTELHQQPRDVGLDRGLADHQLGGDLAVRESPRDAAEDLELARGELVQAGRRRRGGGGDRGELLDQPARDGGRQQRLALRHHADAGGELLGRDVLEQEAAGAGPQRFVDVL